ncbi:MAG: hypothetical protein COZ66_02185 [Candidatus Huberarchaeum crystalense]|uniref:SGNH hydrolase-type esterase domain-containing protein n=2 Tax=Huberarchaeum crystalense TaxID=2014257 RepID=A0A2G9LJ97_HUBC1|nr:hypothetical protein [archaeon]OIP20850.1 MAG: hypothetical protein AUJ91_00180 [archaeon CG2_30_31_98]PIN66617.1 MAG: hypothetical protein COW69_01295 [Candidatus Huberarchaeum crystalense]NCS98225.1 hypothetical protein [archaeon]PIV13549.1 MAG: hypothetical protein COS45_02245 [Candidatus Huberarchaeum crystalense]
MANILVFGDSIAFGAWDPECGYVQKLKTFLDKRILLSNYLNHFAVYNLGVDGDTSDYLLKRLESEIKARLSKDVDRTIILFSIGSNDSAYLNNLKKNWTSPKKFKENIKKLIEIAKKFTNKIVFICLTPVDESKTTPISWNTNITYKNKSIKEYNEIIKEVCQKNKILFIEIFDNWLNFNYKKLLEEGLHPNSVGHQKLFETIKDSLINFKII